MTMSMPTRRIAAVAVGNRQLTVSDCSASVSAVTRYSRSPTRERP
jgi:hypothetical protein